MVKRYDLYFGGFDVGYIVDEADDGGYVAYDEYAALQAENERLMEKVGVTIGVGSGGGNSFVHGDYDSIKVLQGKLLEMERLRSENERLKAERVDMEQFRQALVALSDYAYDLYSDVDHPDCVEADRLLAMIDAHKGE